MRINLIKIAGVKRLAAFFLSVIVISLTANSPADASNNAYIQNNPDGSQTLLGHVPNTVRKFSTFKYHAGHNITAQIIMPLQDQSQLTSLINELNDPQSPNYHHFLTPAQFGLQFGSSTVDAQAVKSFLQNNGISILSRSTAGNVLNVNGSVSAFEKALGLHINYYQRNDGLMFFAPDADPTIPATLAGKILAVGGLDDLPKYHPHLHATTGTLAGSLAQASPKTAGSGPGGFLAPSDVLKAYNLNAVPSTGSGQTIGLFELQGYSSNDIQAYETHFSLPNVPISNVLIDGFNQAALSYPDGADEVTLDIEIAAAMAPGSSINVYEAPNTTQSWIDEWNTIAGDTTVKIISCSWGEPEIDSPTLNFDNMIFQEMAAQGQSVFVASGDSGAYDNGGTTLAVDEPSDQPSVTGVGISKLTTDSSGNYSSESASLYGGGGVSNAWTIPAYQQTVASQAVAAAKVSTTMRNMPDVAMTADPTTAYAFYINGGWGGWWGSSISSPIWAAFMSRVDQGLGAPIGSVNTALYQIAGTSNYTNDFHSITTGNNGYYPAEPGFNDATGLGSFNGLNLYNDLLLNNSGSSTNPPYSVVLNIGQIQYEQVSLVWSKSLEAKSYNIKRSTVSGGPYTTIASNTGSTNTTYADSTVVPGTVYYYVVSAVNPIGESANSNEVIAPIVPSVPLSLQAVPGNGQASLSWVASNGVRSYNVKRSTVNGGPYTTIASNLSNTNYTDTSVTGGTTYYYVVSAVNSAGESANSSQASVTVPAAITTLTASPTSVTANGMVTVTIANGPGNATDWVALYLVGSPFNSYLSWQFLNGSHTPMANGVRSATMAFTMPATPGQYEIRFFPNNGTTVSATSNPITVGANNAIPVLTASPTSVTANGTVTLTIANGPGNTTDWVALYLVGSPFNSYLSWQFLNGSHTAPSTGVTSTTLSFAMPVTAGQYEIRFFPNNSTTVSATSNPITVGANNAIPVLTASPTSVTANGTVTVTIANGPGNATDWVALYLVGSPFSSYLSWQFLNGSHTAPSTGITSKTLSFIMPSTPGQYEIRFFPNNSTTVSATSNPITVGANNAIPVLTASPTSVTANGTVTVTIANGPGNATDWVALYLVGSPFSSYLSWQFLNGSHTAPSTGVTSTTLSFAMPATAGQYEIRFFPNNSTTVSATSNPITVGANNAIPVLTASPTSVTANGTVTVTIANGPGNATDWVALYLVGSPFSSYLSWQFLNGSHTAPSTGITSKTLSFIMPSTPGQYEIRFFPNNSTTVSATSNSVTVN